MSGKTKWTPGPWVADGFFVSSNSGGAVGHDIVSACGTIERPDSETEANAQLIAAAPELLEALQNLMTRVQYDKDATHWFTDEQKAARSAIAKARGESQ